jgi:hypothetical protein
MTTKVNTPNLNATFLNSLVKVNDTQTVNNKTFNSPTLVAPALGTPISGDFSTGAFTWPLFYQDIKANAAFVAANSAGVYANVAFDAANTADQRAVTSGVYANAAFVQANTANTNAATADLKAVISGVFANGAYVAANTADQRAVTSGVYANSAYTQANTATTNAATADQRAVTSGVYANADNAANTGAIDALSAGSYANGAFTTANTKFNSTGGTISGDVTVTGNLTVSGDVVTMNVSNLSIEDNMIYLNANNTVTNPDLGFAGNYNDGVYHHAGIFRDASDGIWKFFYNYDPEPDASPYIDTTHASFRIANLTANLITDVAFIRGYDPIEHANSAYARANTANTNAAQADQRAVTSGVYANSTYEHSNASFIQANSANTLATTANNNARSAGSYANSAFDQANSANTLATTANNNATSAGSYANSAFDVANAAVTTTGTQTLTNKSLSDNTTYFIDENDATKRMQLQLSSIATGATRILTVPNFNGTISTIAGTETLTNKTLTLPVLSFPSISSPIEPITINGSSPSPTLNYYVNANTVVYYTSSSTNDFTWNVGYDGTTTLNTWLPIGRALTIVLLITNAGTAYYPSAITIDGTSVTPKYVGGTAITAGNANSIDSYTMTIIKTASATYTVLLSQTKLA